MCIKVIFNAAKFRNKTWAYICPEGFFGGLISGRAYFRRGEGVYYCREFCASKMIRLKFGRDFASDKNGFCV